MGPRIALTASLMASLGLLAACANPESRQASAQAVEAAADAKDDATCREKGLSPGTKDFDACRELGASRCRRGRGSGAAANRIPAAARRRQLRLLGALIS